MTITKQQKIDALIKCLDLLAKSKINEVITKEQYDKACNDIFKWNPTIKR